MDWNDLRFFLALARTGTLVAAGRELGVEHTTVSRRLGALESALGVKLFTRGPQGLTLTQAGQSVLPNAQAMLSHAEAITRRVQGDDTKLEGVVRLTIPENVHQYMLESLSALRDEHPSLLVELLVDNRELDLRRGEADIAFRLLETVDPELLVKKIGSAGWSLYAAPSYVARKGVPASARDVTGHDVIGYDTSLLRVCGANWVERYAKDANIVLRGNTLSAIQTAAGFGFGIAALPCVSGDTDPRIQRLTSELIGVRTIYLVVHPDLAQATRVRTVMDFLTCLLQRDAACWLGASSDIEPRDLGM